MVERRRIELPTFALRTRRSPSLATAPYYRKMAILPFFLSIKTKIVVFVFMLWHFLVPDYRKRLSRLFSLLADTSLCRVTEKALL